MASFRRASNQAEWQRPPQRTPHSHIAYLPGGVLQSAPLLMPSGRRTAHPGAFESVLPGSARPPPPPPPRRGLSKAQAALSVAGQAHISLSRGSSLQPAVHQAASHYGVVLHPPQQQQQQWLLPGQAQNQPDLPFQGHQAWLQAADGQPSYIQQQHMAVPQQTAEHQPALQQPGMAPQMRNHSRPSAQHVHGRPQPQPQHQPSVQYVTQQTAPQRVFSTQKSSLNGNARPFVGSAKASASLSVAADVYSEASGSDVSSLCSIHASPSTGSPLQGAATGRYDQRRVDKQLNASARAYIPQKSLNRNAQEERQTDPQLHLNVAAQDSVLAVESGLQPAADVECMCHLLLPEPTASRGQPTPKQAGQHPLCQKLLEQAPEQPQEQLPELAESSGDTGPTSGVESVSPSPPTSAAAEHVPPVPVEKVPFANDDVAALSLSTSTPTSAAAERVPYVCTQKVPVASDDAPTPSSSIKAGALNEGHLNESAGSFTLGAHRGSIHHGQQASDRLGSDASHPQTDTAASHSADGAGSAVTSELAVATAVDLADSDCSTEAALDKTFAHSSASPGTAAIDDSQPLSSDSDSPTTAASSSGAQPFQSPVSTAEAGSASQPSSDASSAGAAHASTRADKLAVRGAVSSGQATTAVAELTDSTSAAQTSSNAASISGAAPRAGIRGLSSPSGSFLATSEAQSEPSNLPASSMGIGGAQSGPNRPPGFSTSMNGILSGPSSSSSSSSITASTAADTWLDDSRSMLRQAEGKPEAAAETATAAKSVFGHISSSAMASQAGTSAEDDMSSITAADGKNTGAVRASAHMQLTSASLSTADSDEIHTADVLEASKAPAASEPALMQRLSATASSSTHPPLETPGCSSRDSGLHIDTLAQSASSPSLNILVEGEKGAQPMPSSLPQGGEAHPPAVRSSATAAAEQVSAFAWEAAQLQSVTHATDADSAAPVSSTHGEDTVQRSWSSEATEVQSVVGSQQQASCSEQQQDSSSVSHEEVVEFTASAQQSVEQQHTSSSAAFEEQAQPANEATAPVQPHQSLQQSAGEEEEQVPDAATAREQQASSSTSKDEDDGDAAQRPVNEEEQQQLPGRSTGHDAHHHASTEMEDCKVSSGPSRQEEERIALLTQTKVEGQSCNSPDPVGAEDWQGPFQLATEEDKQKIASSSPVREEEEQGLRQSAAQEDKQQPPLFSPVREADEQGFSQSASEVAEEGQRPTDPSHDAEQSADTSGHHILSPPSPVSEEEAAHQLQTNNACDARLQAKDTSCRAEPSSQTKAKPGFLAKALFCSVAWPVLVPVVAFSSCVQLYDACSMSEVLRYTV